jgi:RNA 3'-terminal phosphate cyclase (ATP)
MSTTITDSAKRVWRIGQSARNIGLHLSDAIGELHKSSEKVGEDAARNIHRELESRATVDIHLADMLVPYVALAKENSVYLTRFVTEHLETNLWLTSKIQGTEFTIEKRGSLYRIECKGR